MTKVTQKKKNVSCLGKIQGNSKCGLRQLWYFKTKLLALIDNDDTAATIFYLKPKGKRRGYVEKQEFALLPPQDEVSIDYSQLSDDAIAQIRAATRKQSESKTNY